MKIGYRTKFAIIVLMILFSSFCFGDIICEYDIGGANGATASPFMLAEGVMSSDISAHGVSTLNPGWGYPSIITAKGWSTDSFFDVNKYFQFEITADEGQAIVYESISL